MPSSFSRPCRRSCTLLAIMALAAMISWPTAWAEPPAERLSPQSVEFEGVEDKLPLEFRDIAALAALFHQVKLDVDPKLHYSEVVRLTRVLAGLSVTKIFIVSSDK
jgi:hypothetical protein